MSDELSERASRAPKRELRVDGTSAVGPEFSCKGVFDKVFGVLVRAETKGEARRWAQRKAGNEGLSIYQRFGGTEDKIASNVWLNPA